MTDSKNESKQLEETPRRVRRGEDPAIGNQSSVTPYDYPKDDGGRPDYGSPYRS